MYFIPLIYKLFNASFFFFLEIIICICNIFEWNYSLLFQGFLVRRDRTAEIVFQKKKFFNQMEIVMEMVRFLI